MTSLLKGCKGLIQLFEGMFRSHCGSDAAGFRRYCWRSHSRRIDIQFEKALCECGCFLGVTDENRHNRADRGRQSKPHGLESVVEIGTVLPQTDKPLRLRSQEADGGCRGRCSGWWWGSRVHERSRPIYEVLD